ncbi:MAG TPA: HAMP domain-containing sensor histidine kinase [Pyrinomonadaceae bacterium]
MATREATGGDVKDVKSARAHTTTHTGCAKLPDVGWRFTTRAPSFVLLLAAALVALLALLATLQYRWLGQVSTGERERMQSTLRASTARFTQDFDREIGRVYFGFQLDERIVRAHAWSDFAERYRHWQASAPYPRMVRAVYLAEHNEADEDVRLLRFDPATGDVQPVAWPAEFAALHQRFTQKYLAGSALPLPEQVAPLPPLVGDLPAVIVPALTTEPFLHLAAREQPLMLKTWLAPASHVIAVLDLDYIRTELLPTLARRYFASSGDQLDYNLTIRTRTEPPRIIYQSAPQTPTQGAGDTRAGLFTVRFDEMDVFLPTATPQLGAPPGLGVREKTFSVKVFRRGGAQPTNPGEPVRVALNTEDDGDWELIVAHPAGSLDAAVAGARRRSLAVSFGVLLLLAASVALLVVSTHRAQRLARQQMEFVAGVTHELRTPLAVICSAGENLADGVIAEGTQVRRYGQLIRGEGRRLADMVEQVLELAGAQRGRRMLELRPVEVAGLLEQTLAAWQAAQDAAPHVERHVAPQLPPVLADEPALRRALQNLLSNALKYGGGGSWIGVTAHATAGARGREVQIKVADHGLGIDAAELPHIFEPFYRGRDVRAAQIHGNGLGLSLVKDIVEAHGGRVTVESAPGRGSAFTLHLPAYTNGQGNGDGL